MGGCTPGNFTLEFKNSMYSPTVICVLSKEKIQIKKIDMGAEGGATSGKINFGLDVDHLQKEAQIPIQPNNSILVSTKNYDYLTLTYRNSLKQLQKTDYVNVPLVQYKNKKELVICMTSQGELILLKRISNHNWKCQSQGVGTTIKSNSKVEEFKYPNGHCEKCQNKGYGYCVHKVTTQRQTKQIKQSILHL